MESNKETIEILNDLVEINNDRMRGFERAKKELEGDAELQALFAGKIAESQQFKQTLAHEIQVLGSEVENEGSFSGKLHRTWLELKANFSGHDEKSILEECEFGEDAINKTYRTALEEEHLPAYIRDILDDQLSILITSHDEIKALRDSASVRH